MSVTLVIKIVLIKQFHNYKMKQNIFIYLFIYLFVVTLCLQMSLQFKLCISYILDIVKIWTF